MSQYKSNLGKKRVIDTDAQPRLNNSNKVVTVEYKTVSWGQILKVWGKNVLSFLLLGLVLVSVVYAGLAATVLYAATSDNGAFYVVRGTYVGGKVPAGQTVYATKTGTIEGNFLTNLQEGFTGIPNAVIVKTLAGPVARIYVDPNTREVVTVNENNEIVESFDGTLAEGYENSGWLKEQYLVKCVAGDCVPGELLILNQNQISGKVVTEFKAK